MLGPYPTKRKAGPLLIFRAYFSESVSIFFLSPFISNASKRLSSSIDC
jgi:hypothetical protein